MFIILLFLARIFTFLNFFYFHIICHQKKLIKMYLKVMLNLKDPMFLDLSNLSSHAANKFQNYEPLFLQLHFSLNFLFNLKCCVEVARCLVFSFCFRNEIIFMLQGIVFFSSVAIIKQIPSVWASSLKSHFCNLIQRMLLSLANLMA